MWGLAGADAVCFTRSVARFWRVISPRNVSVKLVAVLFRIREIPSLNLNPEAIYPFCGFKKTQPLQARACLLPQTGSEPLPSTSFPVHYYSYR